MITLIKYSMINYNIKFFDLWLNIYDLEISHYKNNSEITISWTC